MNEVLLKKIKYLLEFKYNEEENPKYLNLLEKIFYDFIFNMELIYNKNEEANVYYNTLLNKLNDNIKSIIIPSDKFAYHDMGFLELNTNLVSMLMPYKVAGVTVNEQLKQEILKKNYFYHILLAIKKVKNTTYLDNYINEINSIAISRMNKFYKNNFTVVCPDGTKYNYFMYSKILGNNNFQILNMMNILEIIIGKDKLMDYYLNKNTNIILDFNKEYDSIIGNLRYDNNGKIKYNPFTLVNEFTKRFIKEDSIYKKVEYLKKLNCLLFEMFNYKLTKTLNSKDDEKIKEIYNDMKVLEENMLYNVDNRLNSNLEHVKIFMTMKIKLSNYLNNDKKNIRNEYTIYSTDKKRSDKVTTSVQPINIKNKNVLINIMDIKNINHRVLVRINTTVVDYDTMRKKTYDNIYLSLREIKHIFSTSDLGVMTKESEVIRNAIANRIIDKNIMKIIVNERNNYLGDFSYDKDLDKCIIYKNQSVIDYLGKTIRENIEII